MEGSLRDDADAGLKLVETLKWEACCGYTRLPAHIHRLRAGAKALGIDLDEAGLARALASPTGDAPQRVRLAVGLDGSVAATSAPVGRAKPEWVLVLAGPRIDSADPWLRLKTTRRPVHDAVRATLAPPADEALLLNERGELCEGTITTLFADLGAGLLTPPVACGLLPGVLRAELLASGAAREAVLRPEDLRGAALYIGNSLRGLIPARLGIDAGGGAARA